jgi:aspartate kinase
MLSVLKLGGSVLRDEDAFARAARWLRARLDAQESERLVVIVSAEHGATDALVGSASAICANPDPVALDLLWSTGEIRSVARLVLHLQAAGVRASGLNVHQTGLVAGAGGHPGRASLRPLYLLAALGRCRLVVVPGFLATAPGGAIRSLGRGGSDLTAVIIAAGLRADRCELVKDVPGYHTSDPNRDRGAIPIADLSYDAALAMADAGCDLVQRAALECAREHRLSLIVRGFDAAGTTVTIEGGRSWNSLLAPFTLPNHQNRAPAR